MGLSIQDLTTNVRLRLGDPSAQAPNDQAVLNAVCSGIRTLLQFRRVTGNPWNFNDLPIQVVPQQDTYIITASDFGQPMSVMTYDPTNPIWIPRLVKIYEPQNLILDIPPLPNAFAANAYWAFDNSGCTAQRVCFYWRDNTAYIQFWPLPTVNAQYLIRYLQNADGVNAMSLATAPFPGEDDDLIELRAAISMLPLSQWWSEDTAEHRAANAAKRQQLMLSLKNDEQLAAQLFDARVRQPTGPRIYQRWNPSTV